MWTFVTVKGKDGIGEANQGLRNGHMIFTKASPHCCLKSWKIRPYTPRNFEMNVRQHKEPMTCGICCTTDTQRE